MSKENNKNSKALAAGIALCFCLLLAFEVWKFYNAPQGTYETHLYSLITTIIGSALFLFVVIYSSYTRVLRVNVRALPRCILFSLPCFLVAVNNFPIIPFLSGKAYITGQGAEIFLYFLVCLGTGLFEELVFRGYIFMMILEKRKNSKKEVFFAIISSSAIFGLMHIVNLFAGAGPLAVLLQVGYSFLVGGMCAILLIKTGSVWYPVLVHAVYNFSGGVVPRFGGGTIWDAPTVIITVILSVSAAAYLVIALVRMDVNDIRHTR